MSLVPACCGLWAGGVGWLDVDCWGQLGMCVSVSVFKTRRLEQEQQQQQEGDLKTSLRPVRAGIWRFRGFQSSCDRRRGGPIWFSALEPFPANMDDLGKFVRRGGNIKAERVRVCAFSVNTQC